MRACAAAACRGAAPAGSEAAALRCRAAPRGPSGWTPPGKLRPRPLWAQGCWPAGGVSRRCCWAVERLLALLRGSAQATAPQPPLS
ncbi:hypothetical protein U9M48_004321 [Paspalum notatum var. saurae]|uniref:Uncharacterized protein n=1 Tax=Paspalum notatum var. saurae TaxID=547442 RepID=A0AAQ3PME2_PASNO